MGSPENVLAMALVVLLVLSVAYSDAMTREPTKTWGCLGLLAAVTVPSCGGCYTLLNNIDLGGGTNAMFSPNMPRGYDPSGGTLLAAGVLLGWASLWPLRRATLAQSSRQAPGLVILAGAWLFFATGAVAWFCQKASLFVDRRLLPFGCLGVLLGSLGLAWRYPSLRWLFAGLGAAALAATAWLSNVWSRSPVARCEAAYPSLVLKWHESAVEKYRAPGVELVQLVCQMTFQYADQDTRLVYGRLPNGSVLVDAPLFARVNGTPRQRASAARDLLFADDCNELALPESGMVGVAEPVEQGGKLVFYGLHDEYYYGLSTHVGMMVEPTRYEVDLRTFATSFTRLSPNGQ
ncbi:MAG TPA: hypothetical protein VEQ58_11330 [Polyangiaceae bacterium]|nr:hypothetical protein [Polyangiaceae bacterium]